MKILRAFYHSNTPFIIHASFKSIGISLNWNKEGDWTAFNVSRNQIIQNHQDKFSPTPKKYNRKRAPIEIKNKYFINEAEIIEKEHGLYPFCHQQKIKNEYKQEKKPFEIIRTILKVAKLLLDYALKKKNFTK